MEIIFLLVCVSVSLSVLFLIGFLWSVKSGQYEDCYTPSVRMLFEDRIENEDDSEINLKGE